ncbi:flagellar hook-basal body protein [Paenibacillus sp. GCM10012307]|uniref:Flagellar hook-basal body protein n=1 Tax=Paenibacillus roseus TaxID=2798579 RepID=A0A934MPB4_9BACL|nr:flagellar hook-basal body protein [Paenibacillus roseus]MBJ6361901.1 flagellar hook-basal body protein [Paenibacillus roseus]
MLRGLYTAAAGMVTQQRRHDTVTNNISNLNTPGFKQVNAISRSFPDMLISLTGLEPEHDKRLGVVNTGVFAEESLSIHLQGDLSSTDRPSDFAILSDIDVPGMSFDSSGKYVNENGETTFQPQVFFTLRDRSGETRYTRDGKFTLNNEGFLVTGDGSFVLGIDNNPIQFAPNIAIDQLKLNANQQFIDNLTGNNTGEQLLLTRIENPNMLVREGNSKFQLVGEDNQSRAVNAGDRFEVRQGYVERSNVDASQSMIDIMAALRAYEANQKVVQYYDRSLEKAVNEVGRI